MGLKDLTHKQFKEFKKFLAFFDILGVSEEDLRQIPNIKTAMEKLDALKTNRAPVVLSENEQKAITEKFKDKMTPEQIMAAFAKETEDFYPDGRKPSQ